MDTTKNPASDPFETTLTTMSTFMLIYVYHHIRTDAPWIWYQWMCVVFAGLHVTSWWLLFRVERSPNYRARQKNLARYFYVRFIAVGCLTVFCCNSLPISMFQSDTVNDMYIIGLFAILTLLGMLSFYGKAAKEHSGNAHTKN